MNKRICPKCKQKFNRIHNSQIYCDNCGIISESGYQLIHMPNHPRANSNGYIGKSALVMEKDIKRFLTTEEVVHHKDGNKLNNNIKNLILFKNKSEHRKYHNFMFYFLIKHKLFNKFHKFWLQNITV